MVYYFKVIKSGKVDPVKVDYWLQYQRKLVQDGAFFGTIDDCKLDSTYLLAITLLKKGKPHFPLRIPLLLIPQKK